VTCRLCRFSSFDGVRLLEIVTRLGPIPVLRGAAPKSLVPEVRKRSAKDAMKTDNSKLLGVFVKAHLLDVVRDAGSRNCPVIFRGHGFRMAVAEIVCARCRADERHSLQDRSPLAGCFSKGW